MIKIKIYLSIIKKELLEIIRDKSSIIVILLPLVFLPIISSLINCFLNTNTDTVSIGVVCENINDEKFFTDLFQNENVLLNFSYEKKDKSFNGNSVVIEKRNTDFNIYYDSSSMESLLCATNYKANLEKILSQKTLYDNHLTIPTINLCNENNTVENEILILLKIILPFIIIIFIFRNIENFASVSFSSEKEKGTLEILYLTLKEREKLYIGKSISMIIISLVFSILMILSIAFSLSINSLSNNIFNIKNIKISNLLFLLLNIIIVAIVFSFITTFLSMISKSRRSSQMISLFFNSTCLTIVGSSALGFSKGLKGIISFIPVLSQLTLIFNIFSNTITFKQTTIAYIESFAIIVLLIKASKTLLKNERIIR